MIRRPSAYQEAISNLFQTARLKNYPKNQLVQYQGDPMTDIYMIKAGYIKVYTILETGDTRTLFILGPGDVFPVAFSTTLDWSSYKLKYFYQCLTDMGGHNGQHRFQKNDWWGRCQANGLFVIYDSHQ